MLKCCKVRYNLKSLQDLGSFKWIILLKFFKTILAIMFCFESVPEEHHIGKQ